MTKKWIYFSVLTVLIVLIGTGFKETHVKQFGRIEGFHLAENEIHNYSVAPLAETSTNKFTLPYTGKTFIAFKQAIGIKESQCLYRLVSRYGYMGKYQFGKSALRAIGIYNTNTFLHDPALQERAFKALLSINKWKLRREIKKYDGKNVGGVKITESGILAAAHLAGAQSVKNYLHSNGNIKFRDGFGTTLKSYLKKFGGYDTSNIVANARAKA